MENLELHFSQAASDATRLVVTAFAEVKNGQLHIHYHIDSPRGAPKLIWKSAGEHSERKDELWKTTCLEAFVLLGDGSYFEINIAPEGDWNVYHFNKYRVGMKREAKISSLLTFNSSAQSNGKSAVYDLSAAIDVSRILKSPQNFRLGLTAVIETEGGERSYWSLKHAGEKPDFHDSRGHLLEMRI